MPRTRKDAIPRQGERLAPTKLWELIGRHPGKPWVPHDGQAEILSVLKTPWPTEPMSDGLPYPSIISANCGRQFGKTEIGPAALWQGLTAPDDNVGPPQVRLTADTEEHTNKVWDRFIWTVENTEFGRSMTKSYEKDRSLVTLHTGATAQRIPGWNPQALSGDSVTLWVVDEAQFFSWAAWTNMLPSIIARNGVILMLGVAQGDGPYREMSRRGELENRQQYPRYLTLRYSSYDNPFAKKEAIDLMAAELSPVDYRNLILAEWDTALGRVFANVPERVYTDEIQKHPDLGFFYTQLPLPGHTYYGGLDLAILRDYTVFSIWTPGGRLVAWDRFHRLASPRETIERVVRFSEFWGHPLTVPDETGIGIPMVDDMRSKGMRLQPYQISSNPAKKLLVDSLQRRFTNNWIELPNDKDVKEEFSLFEAKQSTAPGSNVVKYGAPSGKNDDIVMSAALATQVLPQRRLILPRGYNPDEFRQRGPWEDL